MAGDKLPHDIFHVPDDGDDAAAEPCEGEVAAGIEADDYDDDTYDTLINAKLLLPKGDQLACG